MNTDLAKTIRQRRQALGLKPSALAKRIGKTRQNIWNWESGRTKPSSQDLLVLAEHLDCTVDDLLRGVA